MKTYPIILASASPRRVGLLESLGYEFTVMPSRAEELMDAGMPLAELCAKNAVLKAREVAQRNQDTVVIGADTLVGLRGRVFGKPGDLDEAAGMLRALSGQVHEVVTGVCIIFNEKTEIFTDRTEVTFHTLAEPVIQEYLRKVPVLDKAGSYGIQEYGEMLVEKITGSFSNVMGFPTEKFKERARSFPVKG